MQKNQLCTLKSPTFYHIRRVKISSSKQIHPNLESPSLSHVHKDTNKPQNTIFNETFEEIGLPRISTMYKDPTSRSTNQSPFKSTTNQPIYNKKLNLSSCQANKATEISASFFLLIDLWDRHCLGAFGASMSSNSLDSSSKSIEVRNALAFLGVL